MQGEFSHFVERVRDEDATAHIRHMSLSIKGISDWIFLWLSQFSQNYKKQAHLGQALVLEDPPWQINFNEPFIILKMTLVLFLFNVSKNLKQMTDSEFDKVKNDSHFNRAWSQRGSTRSIFVSNASGRERNDCGEYYKPVQMVLKDTSARLLGEWMFQQLF